MIDVNIVRGPEIALHGLTKADCVYAIYYDETNNIRRLHVRSDGLNVREPKCFVIGGIAYAGPVRALQLDDLRLALRVQQNVTEMKLKHVATGEFLDLIKAKRLSIFIEYLLEHGLFVHYSVIDPLYWSIVDVIDSTLTERGEPTLMAVNMLLKNDLYAILRHDYDRTVDIFQRYSYPDVGRERRRAFVAELRELLEHRRNLIEHFNYMMLKGILQIAETLDTLPYLEDETPNLLIDGFVPFYVQRICLFKNSQHIFDVEDVIRERLKGIRFTDGDREVTNFRFAVSQDEPGVQVSDVITGLLGKFFSFICATKNAELVAARRALGAQQEHNLSLLKSLLDRSIGENKAFAHSVLSLRDRERAAFFLDK